MNIILNIIIIIIILIILFYLLYTYIKHPSKTVGSYITSISNENYTSQIDEITNYYINNTPLSKYLNIDYIQKYMNILINDSRYNIINTFIWDYKNTHEYNDEKINHIIKYIKCSFIEFLILSKDKYIIKNIKYLGYGTCNLALLITLDNGEQKVLKICFEHIEDSINNNKNIIEIIKNKNEYLPNIELSIYD